MGTVRTVAGKTQYLNHARKRPRRRGHQLYVTPITWLAPLTPLQSYLELLDWTGRQLRAGTRGVIPQCLESILDRLKVSAESWLETVEQFGRAFSPCGGFGRPSEGRGPASGGELAARRTIEPGGIRALALSLTAPDPLLRLVAVLPGSGLTGGMTGSRRAHARRNKPSIPLPAGKSPRNYAPLSPGLSWPARCCYRDKRSEFIVDPRARLELQNVGGTQRAALNVFNVRLSGDEHLR